MRQAAGQHITAALPPDSRDSRGRVLQTADVTPPRHPTTHSTRFLPSFLPPPPPPPPPPPLPSISLSLLTTTRPFPDHTTPGGLEWGLEGVQYGQVWSGVVLHGLMWSGGGLASAAEYLMGGGGGGEEVWQDVHHSSLPCSCPPFSLFQPPSLPSSLLLPPAPHTMVMPAFVS